MSLQLLRRQSDGSSSSDSRELSIEDLANVSFGTYLVVVRLLLANVGYEFAGSLGRDYLRSYKSNGGADLVVWYRSLQGPIKVLIQVKQETRRLQRRYIDELRGVMQRVGVSHGLIITLGRASIPALIAADGFPGRPVSILQGDELLRFVCESLNIKDGQALISLSHVRLANQPIAEVSVKNSSKEQVESTYPKKSLGCATEENLASDGNSGLVAVLIFLLGLMIGVTLK